MNKLNSDFRAVFLTSSLREERERREARSAWIKTIAAGVAIGLAVSGLLAFF